MRTLRIIAAATAVALGAAHVPAGAGPRPVDVQLLAINDLHGHLEPGTPGEIAGEAAGGAAFLAAHVRRLALANPNTTVVSAGDLIGASPLLSALFRDEPTIEAMNLIGLDLNAVGNHELDEGADELRRMARGGCHPADGCFGGDGFDGARFGFLAANTVDATTRRPLFAPYAIRRYGGLKVGFIGLTLEGTREVTRRSAVEDLTFLDEAETANRYAREMRATHGVRAIVVLLHEGGAQERPAGIDGCDGISGPVVDIVERTTAAVDVFVTGHTHTPYTCVIDGRAVTSAASYGRLVTDIDLRLDRRSGDVTRVRVDNVVVSQRLAPEPDVAALVERYARLAAPVADRVVGMLGGTATRRRADSGESAAGNLIADAQLAATRDAGAVAAFVNPGGIRGDLEAGEVTHADAFAVQPFGNPLVTVTLTGRQLVDVLAQQWCGQTDPTVLSPSAGVAYSYDADAAAAATGGPCATAANPVTDFTIDEAPVVADATYRVTVTAFLAEGGDGFTRLREGTDRRPGPNDLTALETYLGASPAGPPAADRIDRG